MPSSITVAHEETLRTWANTYIRAVRQRTVYQGTTMAKAGTLPHYLYTAKISEVAKTTEEYSIPLIVSTDVSTAVVNEKEVVIEEVQEDDNEKPDEFEPSSDEEEELEIMRIRTLQLVQQMLQVLMKDRYSWLVV